MGKVIVKNIRGMGWGARTCLIAVFTMLATVLCLQMRDAKDAQAAVAVQTQWAIIGTGSTSTFPTMTLAKGAGSNRLLVVKVVAEYGTAITTFTPTVSYGGQALTKIVATDTSSRQKVWFGYLNEAKIAAATGTTPSITVSWNSTPSGGVGLSAAFYSNVNQATPTTGSRAVASDTSATTPTSGTISVTAGGTAIYGSNVNGALAASLPANYTEHFDTANSTLYQDAVGSKPITASGTENPLPTWTSARYGFAAIGLNPATTALGAGVAGSSVNVAPGATAQKLGGFSLATGSAGTTDSVTGLTVTTTNNAAIASLSIQNEAGTTTYFTAVNNPGSDTWNFSGGTPIPVTNTAANYKIVATYKSRAAGAPAGLTATTARVSAITSGNVLSGSDTAETTLTVSNVHAPSIWGTNSATSSSITLNWSYGTPGQRVVIVRYTANTDTTKPADGRTYVAGVDTLGTGTVRYDGNLTTFTDNVGLQTGTTYYYKIFEYDGYTNYYNATDVWTNPGLTLTVSDAIAPSVNPGFAAKTPGNTLAIPITAGSFVGTDNVGGSGVSGYLITTSASQPAANDPGWTPTAPSTYTVAAAGTYTLYPWVKDGGNNVSPVYAAPVTVVVDMTAPTVASFTVNAQTNSRNIPVGGLTGTDVGTSVAAYMVTSTSTQPAAGAAGWTATAPATFAVAADGTYTLYPWVKDAAGNVSAVSGLTRAVQVDTVGPVFSAVSPADGSTDQPLNTTLQASTATDAGVGNVSYYFAINDGAGYSTNSGWIASTSWAPVGLAAGTTYTWTVTARDGVANPTSAAPRTFTTAAACVRNDPTVTLLTPTGGIASTITVDGGTSVYNLKVVNNDYGGCGSTTFNLGVSDTDVGDVFDPPTLAVPSVTLATGAQTTTTVTVKATVDHLGGAGKTRAFTVADANHAAVTTNDVQTTLNVVSCTKKTPLLIVGPDSGYLNRGGSMKYTVTVKNTDSGTGCTPVTYNLAIPAETNTTDFNASSFSAPSIVLNSGQIGSVTLTVSAKSTAAKNVVNKTTVATSAALHTSPANVVVSSTVNNPMLHNSDSTSSAKWSAAGGWGIPNARYGEFDCTTCHVQGGAATRNAKRIRETVTAPDTAKGQLPGAGQAINYRRPAGTSATQPVPGWDSGATPRTSSGKICEVCHTYDATGANGTKAHPFATTATLGNHFGTDGRDCIDCHKHGKGFSVNGMGCTGCHGTETETITPDNRYVVAPPRNASGLSGTVSGAGNVSNDPKVGAHQTHLKGTIGFSNYSTVDYRCEACHGPVPTNFAHINSSSTPAFQGLATKNGAMSATYSGTKCNNTYCHNPAGTGGTLLAANVGTAVFPSWTSANYVAGGAKSVANCNVCHKVPGDTGFQPAGTHSGMNTDSTDCSGCHGHNGGATGTVAGKRHMDGIKWGVGNCDSCHGYGPGTWADKQERSGVAEGKGAHEKHIAYLIQRNNATLTATSDAFGSGTPWTAVCGVCHNGAAHDMGEAIPGTGRTISITPARNFGGTAVYNGIVGQSSQFKAKTCSNVDCHYKETPVWSSY